MHCHFLFLIVIILILDSLILSCYLICLLILLTNYISLDSCVFRKTQTEKAGWKMKKFTPCYTASIFSLGTEFALEISNGHEFALEISTSLFLLEGKEIKIVKRHKISSKYFSFTHLNNQNSCLLTNDAIVLTYLHLIFVFTDGN